METIDIKAIAERFQLQLPSEELPAQFASLLQCLAQAEMRKRIRDAF